MKNQKKTEKKVERSKFRLSLLMTEEEKASIHNADLVLQDRYHLGRNEIIRRFLLNHLTDGRILLLMGFTPKKK